MFARVPLWDSRFSWWENLLLIAIYLGAFSALVAGFNWLNEKCRQRDDGRS